MQRVLKAWLLALSLCLTTQAQALSTFSIGHCATDEWGGADCENDVDCAADFQKYCNDDTDCNSPTYDTCSGVEEDDFTLQGDVTVDYGTIGFDQCVGEGGGDSFQTTVRKGAFGFQSASPAVFCFDTSSISDTAMVLGALLFLYSDQIDDAEGREFLIDWYTYDGTCSLNEWTKDGITGTAAAFPLSLMAPGTQFGLVLDLPTNVNKTGDTCFRVGISGGATTGDNRVDLGWYDSTLQPGPVLQVQSDEPTVTPTRTPTASRTPTQTRTFTHTRTPSVTSTPTVTRTPTTTNTPQATSSPSASQSPMTPGTSTPTPTGPTPTFTSTFPPGCLGRTLNKIPQQDTSAFGDMQQFMCEEDVDRSTLEAFNFVVDGGEVTGVAATANISRLRAFVDGGYVVESSNVSLLGNTSTSCWIAVSKNRSGNITPFTRVAATHYLLFCGGSKPLPLDDRLMFLASVVLNGSGNITSITDLRGFSEVLRTVETEEELDTLVEIKKGQFGLVLETGIPYVFVQDDEPVAVAEWRQFATEGNAVLLQGDQLIFGEKQFNEYPKLFGDYEVEPTEAAQFTTKWYVDQRVGVNMTLEWDPPSLAALQTATVSVPGPFTSNMTCSANHERLDTTFTAWGISAYVGGSNGVAIVALLNLSTTTVNLPTGTLRVHCVMSDP